MPSDDETTEPSSPGLPRRRFLAGAAVVVGTAGAWTLAPTDFAAAAGDPTNDPTNDPTSGPTSDEVTRTITGFLPTGAPDFVYLPIRVPDRVREIAVSYSYDKPAVAAGTPGNSCDIGIFDERGIRLGGPGFRGWSGGFRTEFTINATEATPGYLPGPVRPGLWHVVLGPYQVAPQGLNYTVQVTLRFGTPGPAFVPAYPPRRAPGRGLSWYRGDCHLHTVYSDGRRLPADVAAAGRARREPGRGHAVGHRRTRRHGPPAHRRGATAPGVAPGLRYRHGHLVDHVLTRRLRPGRGPAPPRRRQPRPGQHDPHQPAVRTHGRPDQPDPAGLIHRHPPADPPTPSDGPGALAVVRLRPGRACGVAWSPR